LGRALATAFLAGCRANLDRIAAPA